jgi:1-aminocyclopropane-1-carboxylate deaminase
MSIINCDSTHNTQSTQNCFLPLLKPCLEDLSHDFIKNDKNHTHMRLCVLRADLLDRRWMGNKSYKLRHHLIQARLSGARRLGSFGGAWSNHLYALAAAGQALNWPTLGLLRGEEPHTANPVLQALRQWGMDIHWVDRQSWRERNQPEQQQRWQARWPDVYWIPEGGGGLPGATGVMDMLADLPADQPWLILTAVGTGTTLAGLIAAAPAGSHVIGVPVLKGAAYLESEVNRMVQALRPEGVTVSWELDHRFHDGGYARSSPVQRDWIRQMSIHTGIPLEPVYSGKAFYAFWYRLQHLEWPAQLTQVLWIHTGGIYPWNNPLSPAPQAPDCF